MKSAINTIFLLLSVVMVACNDNEVSPDEVLSGGLTGTWLLYEQGYSPGAGYITEKVSLFPSRKITLRSDYTFESNFINNYHFYRLIDDPHHANAQILALYAEDPGNTPQNPDLLEHSYSLEINGDKLKLYYRWCFEGCHMALKKIQSEDENLNVLRELCGTPYGGK